VIQLVPQLRILVCIRPQDFRRGIDGLASICRAQLGEDPFSGALFVFTNRARTAVKILAYDGSGFWLSPKHQNAGKTVQVGDLLRIVDPTHALYGQSLPVIRAFSPRAKAEFIVALPDGRARRIPRSITDAGDSLPVPIPVERLTVTVLRPLAQLISAMVAAPEVATHVSSPNDAPPASAVATAACIESASSLDPSAVEAAEPDRPASVVPVSGRPGRPPTRQQRGDRNGGAR
jgi:hypothetical protein